MTYSYVPVFACVKALERVLSGLKQVDVTDLIWDVAWSSKKVKFLSIKMSW